MPRNGSGVAERPPNTNAVSGQTIESADFEASMNDIYSILNTTVPNAYLPSLATLGGVAKSGDTMLGPLALSGDATANLHAVTKQQMDVALALKAATSHTHTASQVTDFSAAADARIAAASINALSDVAITSPVANQVLAYNGTNFVNSNLSATEYNKGTLAADTLYTQAHGLGAYPMLFEVFLQCAVAEFGYSVGDRISAEMAVSGSSFGAVRGASASECFFATRATFAVDTLNKSIRNVASLTLSRWQVVFVVR
jgi:hypothetical protein